MLKKSLSGANIKSLSIGGSLNMRKATSCNSLSEIATAFQLMSLSQSAVYDIPCMIESKYEIQASKNDENVQTCLANPSDPEYFIEIKSIEIPDRYINIILRRRKTI